GPPSPPRGEETSGIISAKITPDKRKACLFAGLAAISQSHRQFSQAFDSKRFYCFIMAHPVFVMVIEVSKKRQTA
ncbi:hypothetical protein ACMUDG_19160, partial [Vibrio cholerae]|uniref:hypothetical protein n=1 Tax=Vibrio cholerae TaxID=666 RepID=UPI0039C94CA8